MKYVLAILFVVYILAGLYLSFASGHFRTRILKGSKVVSKKEKWVYLVLIVSFVLVILLIASDPSILTDK